MPAVTFVRWVSTMLLALAFLILHTTSAQAETVIGSTSVTTDTTWSAADSPYIVDQINVNNGATLTIEPGAELRFVTTGWLAVNGGGNLIAEGTADQPVKFTAHSTNPAPGDWYFLAFHIGSTARLSHCDVAYAGRNGFTAVAVHNSDVSIRDCRIHDNQRDAVVLNPAEVGATLERVQIDNNGGLAIGQTSPDMSPVYTDLTLSDNGTNAIFMPDGTLKRDHSFDGAAAGAPFVLSQLTIANGYTLTVAPECL